MKGFLLQLQLHPQASITCLTVVENGAFRLQVGRKAFKTTPEETTQILNTPGFEDLTTIERGTVILDVVKALSTLNEPAIIPAGTGTVESPLSESRGLSLKKPRTKKEGSFLEIALSPTHYTYARKVRGYVGYAFYDILTTVPLQRKELASFSQQSILLDASLFPPPAWPSLGWLPLTADRSWISYSWTAHALPVTIEESRRGIRNPETEFFLVTEWFNPVANVADSKQTPVLREQLNGLQRWGVTTPAVVEEKLRLHYGLTPTGELIPPLPLSQQPPW